MWKCKYIEVKEELSWKKYEKIIQQKKVKKNGGANGRPKFLKDLIF